MSSKFSRSAKTQQAPAVCRTPTVPPPATVPPFPAKLACRVESFDQRWYPFRHIFWDIPPFYEYPGIAYHFHKTKESNYQYCTIKASILFDKWPTLFNISVSVLQSPPVREKYAQWTNERCRWPSPFRTQPYEKTFYQGAYRWPFAKIIICDTGIRFPWGAPDVGITPQPS